MPEAEASGHVEFCALPRTGVTEFVGDFYPGVHAARKSFLVAIHTLAEMFGVFPSNTPTVAHPLVKAPRLGQSCRS